jgi:branched-chain amino acid transport system permease protein
VRELIEVLITGITIGIVYFLVAVGFTLCYGVGRVLNYSYGSFFT